MNALITSLGGKLAERWLAGLVLPGVVFVAVTIAAVRLGHGHWADLPLLGRELNRFATGPAARDNGSALLVAVGVVLAAVIAAAVAQHLERVVVAVWTHDGGRLGDVLTRRRRRRWAAAMDRYEAALLAKARMLRFPEARQGPVPDVQGLARACDRIALTEPSRPTWIGDQMLVAGVRVQSSYGLDLAAAWPRLWLLLPEETRGPVVLAQSDFAGAARRVGWGVLYLAVGVVWWPAVVVGIVLGVEGWWQGRGAVAALADLVESVVDLNVGALGAALGHVTEGAFSREDGDAVSRLLRKEM
ncbi:hypothetical protein SRB5_03420 [Streptomyces sp. RB5]|uniref:Vegetative cell wall protein gp1 n=1 Tax=Streptomyces smaragdinus TaxID=2585196 RepID=A0A7K0C9V3_9ACTN|nr:hypothetical protein [Streptomyces smaragdinus]MQY10235.1 hypothetical protein [Streptomyces smaragdinus]